MNEGIYLSRCLKTLKKMGAPVSGWVCIEMIDEELPTFVCELCGCEKVRFVHVMHHEDFPIDLKVGCICAGIMEDNILAAKERDRKMKNRAKRRKHFPKRQWDTARDGSFYLNYNGLRVSIKKYKNRYCCSAGAKNTWLYHNKPITDFVSACYAAFDLADPVEEIEL